jgi:hypothetical protein
MKLYFLLLALILTAGKSNAQLFKKPGDKIVRDSEWRLRSKADQQVTKGLDGLLEMSKKIAKRKKNLNFTITAKKE